MRPVRLSLLLLVAATLLVFLPACTASRNQTTPRGPGGLSIQTPPAGPNTIVWTIPTEFQYTGAQPMYRDNNRIFVTTDPYATVLKHYEGLMPEAARKEIRPNGHVELADSAMKVDIEKWGETQTKLVFTPVNLAQATGAKASGCRGNA